VSLLPSATEIVYALGLGDDLVGVTFECDEPAAARAEKEVVVGGRDTAGMTPAEIDAYVRDRLASGEDLYTLHADALARLRPELILTQDLCRVCARPRVAVVEWVDPPFAAGHWIPDLVTAAGGEPVAARPHQRSAPITWWEISAAAPDLVIVAPCGYHLAGAVAQAAAVTAALAAVPVWAIDADSLVVRPGPRLVDGVAAIAAILHPDAVPAPPDGQIAPVRTLTSRSSGSRQQFPGIGHL
jgi:iron complex transport system substrate-binding protein